MTAHVSSSRSATPTPNAFAMRRRDSSVGFATLLSMSLTSARRIPAAPASSAWLNVRERLRSLTLRASAAFARRSMLAKDSYFANAVSASLCSRSMGHARRGPPRLFRHSTAPVRIRQGFVEVPGLSSGHKTGPHRRSSARCVPPCFGTGRTSETSDAIFRSVAVWEMDEAGWRIAEAEA